MFICKRMFKILVLISFYCFAYAEKSAECDCNILQIYSEDNPDKYYNFTKQWDKQGGNYFYFSMEHYLKRWNNQSNEYETTLFQSNQNYQIWNHISCQNISHKLSFELPWKINESEVFESRCLQDNKCSVSKEDVKGKISNIHYFSRVTFHKKSYFGVIV